MSTNTTLSRIARNQSIGRPPFAASIFLIGWTLDTATTIINISLIGWGLESGPVVSLIMDTVWNAWSGLNPYLGAYLTAHELGYLLIAVVKLSVSVGALILWTLTGLDEYWWGHLGLAVLGLAGVCIAALNLIVGVTLGGL